MNRFMISFFCSQDGSLRSGWRFAVAAAYFLFAEYTCAYLTFWLLHRTGSSYLFESMYRPLLLLMLIFGFGVLARAPEKIPPDPISAQGLGRSGPWKYQLLLGAGLGIFVITLAVLMVAALGSYSLQVVPTSPGKVSTVLWILLTAAAAEEVAFRGYPFQTLVQATGKWAAVLLMSALFGALHLTNPDASLWSMLNTMLIGVLLCVAYLRSKSLWLPIGVHFGWNLGLGFIYGLPVSGLSIFAVVVKGRAAGPQWLTGGDYGIEASLTGAVAILTGMIMLTLATSSKRTSKWMPVAAVARIEPIEQKNQ